MTEDAGRWLLTPSGRELASLAVALHLERTELPRALARLRKAASPDQAAAAWELADLRIRGQAKFGADAAQMFFVREALEQASALSAAKYHARRFASAGFSAIADVCGGIGGDAIAFARAGLQVTLYEQDPLRACFAAANVEALGCADQVCVITADATVTSIQEQAVWFDPGRRTARGRAGDPEDYQPPLSLMTQWQDQSIGVKLAPAIPHELAKGYNAELEFLSGNGECKEALLWTGALGVGVERRAVLLRDNFEFALTIDDAQAVALAEPQWGRFLYEPDPAVIRAHGVGTLAAQLDARLIAPQIAYLAADNLTVTPFASAYTILERFSYSRRRLQEALIQRGVGTVVIKKRGFPREPDEIRRELRLHGTETLTVVLTRAAAGDGHQAILCHPLTAE